MPLPLQSFLKNISQVVLLENVWTGLLILIALWIGDWKVGLAAMIGSAISLVTAPWFGYTREEIHAGLAGFNSVLVAIGLTIFMVMTWQTVMVCLIATIIAMPLAKSMQTVLRRYQLPELTTPFVLVTWMVLLMNQQFAFLKSTVKVLPLKHTATIDVTQPLHPVIAFFNSMSQIFLVENVVSGILIIIAFFIASRWTGFFVIIANVLSMLFVYVLGTDAIAFSHGLLGYNIILTVIAVAVTFRSLTRYHRYLILVLVIVLTPMIYGATATLLEPFGIPILTLPFIIVTWILLLAGQNQPTTHQL
ncbi:urea transporter [Staphylococcus agnetis]|uniref:urea transporter n=1 Tax=Staphylococcus agnetis TaxID=985762 RepID=UPI000D1A8E26|nr:urea transporter [Staphylococcus agnetis]NJI12638.1 urea transporter [Staphylococcus agnetis]PTH13767.1 urea transporter [Staphylococcus agnetis]PTH29052.1 urea transporter [Staphylococcus agnetis]PTH35019.1 urea transporter [Staphylococcus agnetis]QIN25072.1 urea transporter [Staphylococcus agnetis]